MNTFFKAVTELKHQISAKDMKQIWLWSNRYKIESILIRENFCHISFADNHDKFQASLSYVPEKNKLKLECSCGIDDCNHYMVFLHEVENALLHQVSSRKKSFATPIAFKKMNVDQALKSDTDVRRWKEMLDNKALSKGADAKAKEAVPIKKDILKPFFELATIITPSSAVTLQLTTKIAKLKKDGNLSKNSSKLNLSEPLTSHLPFISEEDIQINYEFLKQRLRKKDSFSYFYEANSDTLLLKRLIKSGRCFFEGSDEPLTWGVKKKACLCWQIVSNGHYQQLGYSLDDAKVLVIPHLSPPIYLDTIQGIVGEADLYPTNEIASYLAEKNTFPHEKTEAIQELLNKQYPNLKLKPINITPLQIEPKPHLHVNYNYFYGGFSYRTSGPYISGSVTFHYNDIAFPRDSHQATQVVQKETHQAVEIIRDFKKEEFFEKQLIDSGWNYLYNSNTLSSSLVLPKVNDIHAQILDFHKNEKSKLEEMGWKVSYEDNCPIKTQFLAEDFYIDNTESEDKHWLEFELGTMVEGKKVNLIPILTKLADLYKQQPDFFDDWEKANDNDHYQMSYGENDQLLISKKRLFYILKLLLNDSSKAVDGKLKLSHWHAALLAEIEKGDAFAKWRWYGSEKMKKLSDSFKNIEELPTVTPPTSLQCQLRTYQAYGLTWLQFLREHHLGGILADDMGLGKTIQTLAHILVEKESGRLTAPILIVAPTSLMFNWRAEAEKFAPTLKVLVLQGADRKQYFEDISAYDVVLTTYPLLAHDQEYLLKKKYYMLILDEAQNIKNSKTIAYQLLMQIEAEHRLCLTGTPMENHLGELWALFNFLVPGYLGNEKQFTNLYRKPIEKERSSAHQLALAKRIKPFILRRSKQQVVLELPAKTEIIHKINLTTKQRDLYESVRLKAQQKVMEQIAQKGIASSQITILDALLKLRQVCCDPRLVKMEPKLELDSADSAKINFLMETIPQMIEEGRKILIFSQFATMLEIISTELSSQKIPHTILMGSTTDRRTPVDTFQSGAVPVMLLSLKAGGVGLNLTSADTIFHYDPWWNPAVENQATDRAHRIGQTKAVFVYKLLATGTLEEKILALQEKKKEIFTSLLDEETTQQTRLSAEDLEVIFAPLE